MSEEVEPLTSGTIVQRPDTAETGRLLGSFVRRGERWWTIQWGQVETTAEREADILNE